MGRAYRRLAVAILGLVVVLSGWPGAPAQAADATTTLAGQVPQRAVAAAQDIGPLAAGTPLTLTLTLAPQQPAALQALLRAQTTPGQPLYRQFLSTAQFAARFGAANGELAAVTAFLRANGLAVGAPAPDRLLLPVSGAAGQIERAFGVQLHRYRGRAGAAFFAPTSDPRVPAALGSVVRAVHGLDNAPRAQPQARRADRPAAATPVGFTPANIRAAYDFAPAAAGGLNGAGQTLAVFELDGYTPSDVAAYEQEFGLRAVPLQNILVDGVNGLPSGSADEVTLDIELQAAIAPGASALLVYEGPNTDQGVIDTYARIANDDQAAAVSTSWGICEPFTTFSSMQDEALLFEQMAAQGQSLFAASGDDGANGCGGFGLAVDDPASDPWVTGVGGTHLTLAAGGGYGAETAWSGVCGGQPCGGGGGLSTAWAQPSWQTAPNLGPVSGRAVPDVSLDADPTTGYAIYVNGGWFEYGGTSCAAPLWAAWAALTDQYAAQQGRPRLGFAAPALYALAGSAQQYAADFHDITQGSNGFDLAGPGYDEATGLGSMDGWRLLQAAAGPLPARPAITGIRPSSGPVGGGTVVTIAGYNLAGVTAVRFGTVAAASFTVTSNTAISAVTPAEAAGVVDVVVTAPLGSSSLGSLDRYNFVAASAAGSAATAYQGNPAHSGGVQFSPLAAPLQRRWAVDLGGRIGYPLIAQGKVFAIAAPAGTQGAVLYAFDAATGQNVWGPISLGGATSWAAATYDGGRVFTINEAGLLQAFDADSGALQWSRVLPNQWSFTSPPTAANGIVYTSGSGDGGTVYALNEADGQLLWTAAVSSGDNSAPTVTADGLYVAYGCDTAYKFDPVNGSLIWTSTGPCSGGMGATSVYYGGRLYIRDQPLILDAQTGQVVGSFSAGPPPAFAGNTRVDLDGQVLEGVDLRSNTVLWTFSGDGTLDTAPVIVNQTVFEGSANGSVSAVDLTSGALLWTANAGAPAPPDGGWPPSGLAAGDGLLVVPAGPLLVAYASTATAAVGGRDAVLDAESGAVALAWQGGTTQSGYAIARVSTNGVPVVLPAAGPLPATATSFTDSSVLSSAYYCYAVVPLAGTSALGVSDLLCDVPHTRVGAAPGSISIQLDGSTTARLAWPLPTAAGNYQLEAAAANGSAPRTIALPQNAIGAADDTAGVATCYALVSAAGAPSPWNSDVLCAIPGVTTLAGTSRPVAPAQALSRILQAAAALQHGRLPGLALPGRSHLPGRSR